MTKILYVEDEQFLAKIVKESLESRSYEVMMEADGKNALEAFKKFDPDVCVLDVMLPNKDGFEIADEIRHINAQVPIIFLTAKTATDDVVKGFTKGGSDYIRKPFSMEELIVRIENILRLNNSTKQKLNVDTITIGKYTFQLNRQILKTNTEERKLSHRETELLRLLYESKDSIIDRKSILNQVWGNDSFFNSRNLDVYITKLRSYLKEDTKVEIITIKGVGYRFAIS